MMGFKKKAIVGLTAVASLGVLSVGTATAAPVQTVTPFAEGLNGPGGVDHQYGKVYVAEGATGKVLSVNPDTHQHKVELTGFTSPADVARVDRKLVVITAGAEIPDASVTGDSAVYAQEPGQSPKLLADLEAYELAKNPDGQQQFAEDGKTPLDALSNPFAVIRDKRPSGYVLVADAGANAVLAVNSQGKVSTFFLPPQINSGACAGAPNNDPQHPGCDSVPTDITYGPDGYLYVSTLQSLVPGEGRVYVVDAHTAQIKRVITGLTAPTGVTVDKQGNVYTSEVMHGAPEGEGPPPEGFDPSQIGRITKTAKNGSQTHAAVTMPIGLAINTYDNTLYATSWSIAGMLGIPDAGQLVKVPQSAFVS
jgi:hypothetical protein